MEKEQEKALSEYIAYLKLQKKSFKNHRVALRIYFDYLTSMDLDYLRVRFTDAQEYQHYLTTLTSEDGSPRYAAATIVTHIGRLASFYDYLKNRKLIYANPFSDIHRIRRSRSLPKNILKEDEMNRFLNHLKDFMKGKTLIERRRLYKAHVIAELMYSSGARINEVAGLKVNDINFLQGTVRLRDSKTGRERDGILNAFAEKVMRIFVERMREYILFSKMSDSSLIFGAGASLVIWLNSILNREAKGLQLGKFSSHHFRHAIGFHFLRAGCDIRYIQEILGHKELSTTQVYTLVEKEDLRNVLDTFHPRIFKRPVSMKKVSRKCPHRLSRAEPREAESRCPHRAEPRCPHRAEPR
jgi:integrase/recombinase XerD